MRIQNAESNLFTLHLYELAPRQKPPFALRPGAQVGVKKEIDRKRKTAFRHSNKNTRKPTVALAVRSPEEAETIQKKPRMCGDKIQIVDPVSNAAHECPHPTR